MDGATYSIIFCYSNHQAWWVQQLFNWPSWTSHNYGPVLPQNRLKNVLSTYMSYEPHNIPLYIVLGVSSSYKITSMFKSNITTLSITCVMLMYWYVQWLLYCLFGVVPTISLFYFVGPVSLANEYRLYYPKSMASYSLDIYIFRTVELLTVRDSNAYIYCMYI